MTGSQLARAGTLLFGPHWKGQFSDRFSLAYRAVRRIAGDDAVPDGLAIEIETALRDRANEIDGLLETLAT